MWRCEVMSLISLKKLTVYTTSYSLSWISFLSNSETCKSQHPPFKVQGRGECLSLVGHHNNIMK